MKRSERMARIKAIQARIVDIYSALLELNRRCNYLHTEALLLARIDRSRAVYALQAIVGWDQVTMLLRQEQSQLYKRLHKL